MCLTSRPYRLAAVFASVIVGIGQASAAAISITSTVPESGYSDIIGTGLAPLTAGAGFDFAGQPYRQLATLTEVSITLTLYDADSAEDDLDFGKLTLALDGIDTGIVLNGFPDVTLATLTFSGPVRRRETGMRDAIAADAILRELQIDGRLVGAINSTDNPSMNAFEAPADASVTLRLTGETDGAVVPEPSTAGLVGSCMCFVVLLAMRRNRHVS